MNVTLQHIIDNCGQLLAELHRCQAFVRDYVRGVAQHYATGFYLFGPPGTAKTHTVRAVLKEIAGAVPLPARPFDAGRSL